MSAFIATRLSIVSSKVSPLLVDDTTKKRLNTALPRSSGTFFTSRSAIETKGTAVSRMRRITSSGRPSSVSKWVSSPRSLSCGLVTRCTPCRLDRQLQASVGLTIQHDREVTGDGDAGTHIRCFDRQFAAAAIDQHGQFDGLGSAIVEQFVDRRANRAAGVEHVVDQHDAGPADVEWEGGRLDFRAQAFRGVVVAIEGDVDIADRVLS